MSECSHRRKKLLPDGSEECCFCPTVFPPVERPADYWKGPGPLPMVISDIKPHFNWSLGRTLSSRREQREVEVSEGLRVADPVLTSRRREDKEEEFKEVMANAEVHRERSQERAMQNAPSLAEVESSERRIEVRRGGEG
jgi:hypothetical protein